jgi:NADH:ubiquinone oxidoreductase subunit 5 (subunit L)/multisubunit Na+/H+ antiporter MnhA subunit
VSAAAHDATDAAGSVIGAARDAAGRVVNRVGEEYDKRPLTILAIGVGLLALVAVIAALTKSRD